MGINDAETHGITLGDKKQDDMLPEEGLLSAPITSGFPRNIRAIC
jgi:hypothetical protein